MQGLGLLEVSLYQEFCSYAKLLTKKEWSAKSKAFSISTVTRNPFLFKILAVTSAS